MYLTIGHLFTVLIVRTIKSHQQVISADVEPAHQNLTINSFQSALLSLELKVEQMAIGVPWFLRYQGKFGVFGILPKLSLLLKQLLVPLSGQNKVDEI